MKYIADRITIDDDLLNGKPAIRGKRIAVSTILEFLAAGDTKEDILKAYPFLEIEDINACLKFAAQIMNRDYTFKVVA
jgi:uncharacterized protein (DUF433 family)